MQSLFQNGGGIVLRCLLLAVLSIVLMVADHRDQYVDQLRSVLATTLTPLQYAADIPVSALRWTTTQFTTQQELHQTVQRLQRENLRLNARQQQFETLLAENNRLRELLDAASKREERVLVAELLAVDLDPFRQQVIVNQGSSAGVYRGQPVIDARGVMGQVVTVGRFTSTVLLISDPDHALPVQTNRSGLRTIAAGTGDPDRISLLYIPNSADVAEDDLLVTSGLDGLFPANYPVARITEFNRRPGQAFAEVIAKPLANLDRSREVLLVWPDEDERRAREAVVDDPAFDGVQPGDGLPDAPADPGAAPGSTSTTPAEDPATEIPADEAGDIPTEAPETSP